MTKIRNLTSDQELLIDYADCGGVICSPSNCPLKTESGKCLISYKTRQLNPDLEIDMEKVESLYGKKK